jgi:hypothetical protein
LPVGFIIAVDEVIALDKESYHPENCWLVQDVVVSVVSQKTFLMDVNMSSVDYGRIVSFIDSFNFFSIYVFFSVKARIDLYYKTCSIKKKHDGLNYLLIDKF